MAEKTLTEEDFEDIDEDVDWNDAFEAVSSLREPNLIPTIPMSQTLMDLRNTKKEEQIQENPKAEEEEAKEEETEKMPNEKEPWPCLQCAEIISFNDVFCRKCGMNQFVVF